MITNIDPSGQFFLSDLTRLQSALQTTERQISSGHTINEAADAPDQISEVLTLQSQLAQNTQVQSNLNLAQTEVTAADQAISTALQITDQAQAAGAEGASSSATAATRQSLAGQIQDYQQQLVGLSQTAVNGRYVFSGDGDQSPSYQFDASSATGVDRLQTPSNTRQIEDTAGIPFSISQTAQNLFDHRNPDDSIASDNLFSSLNGLRLALLANDTTGISTALDSLKQASSSLANSETFYGTAANRITAGLATASQQTLGLQSQISALRDTNLAQAALDLTSEQTTTQAALQMRGKLPHTSLFDYLG